MDTRLIKKAINHFDYNLTNNKDIKKDIRDHNRHLVCVCKAIVYIKDVTLEVPMDLTLSKKDLNICLDNV